MLAQFRFGKIHYSETYIGHVYF